MKKVVFIVALFVMLIFNSSNLYGDKYKRLSQLESNKRQFIESLMEANKDSTIVNEKLGLERFSWRFHDDQSIRYLGGDNLAQVCNVKGIPTHQEIVELIQCFINENEILFQVKDSIVDVTGIEVISIDNPLPNNYIVKARQIINDLPIKNSWISLTINNGKIEQYSGKLYEKAKIPDFIDNYGKSSIHQEQTRELAEIKSGYPLVLKTRYYDVENQTIISEFFVESEYGNLLEFDEYKNEIVSIKDTSLSYLESKTTTIGDYNNIIKIDSDDNTQIISTEINEFSFLGNCFGILDYNATSSNQQPYVVDDTDYDHHGAGDVFIDFVGCATNDPFLVVDDIRSYYGMLMDSYFWGWDIAQFFHHADTHYTSSFQWENPQKIRIAIERCKDNGGCRYPARANEYEEGIRILIPDDRANELGTLAHELGHAVHFLYGYHSDYSPLQGALQEGFAEQNNLRYALYRYNQSRAWDYLHLTYTTTHNISHQFKEVNSFTHGESEPYPYNDIGADLQKRIEAIVYDENSAVCIDDPIDPYLCGSVMTNIYWEMIWNKCRTAYRQNYGGWGCDVDDTIVANSTLYLTKEEMINYAFTYAIKTIHPTLGDISDFFYSVSSAFNTFYNNGWLDYNDYWRLHSVMNHHCLGSSNHCHDYHITPGNRLPVVFTWHQKFSDGEDSNFIRAKEMVNHGATVHSWGTNDHANYYQLDSGDYLEVEIDFPDNKYYTFSIMASPESLGQDSMYFQIDDDPVIAWHNLWPMEWQWFEYPLGVYVTAGTHSVKLKYRESVLLDALLIE